ncbi:MAG: SH3 domain-containing protein [Candidatus Promineofilum sp.]|nr:SH3 domain-containing protein [Promineifilum sp.]
MSGLLLPILLFAGALAATFLTYRNIRRGGARFYTLEREIILRRAAFTLVVAALLYSGTLALLYYQRQQLVEATLPPEEGAEGAAEGTPGPLVTTPTLTFEQFPPTATATSTTPQPTITPTTVVCRAVVEGTSGSGIYLRDAPQGNELVILAEGTLLTVLDDEPVEAGGFVWRKVREVGGEEGWAAQDYLTIRAPCGDD